MAILKPDNKTTFGGVTVNEYLELVFIGVLRV